MKALKVKGIMAVNKDMVEKKNIKNEERMARAREDLRPTAEIHKTLAENQLMTKYDMDYVELTLEERDRDRKIWTSFVLKVSGKVYLQRTM